MKKTIYIFIIAIAFSSIAYAQDNDKLFAMIYSKGPEWNEKVSASKQDYFKAHSLHLQNLRKLEKILMGGRYSDLGFMILKAKNMPEAQLITKKDSSVVNGIFKVELFEFKPFYNGCIGEEH
ncbi:YciI family protein [Lacinutrix chionoecetis]